MGPPCRHRSSRQAAAGAACRHVDHLASHPRRRRRLSARAARLAPGPAAAARDAPRLHRLCQRPAARPRRPGRHAHRAGALGRPLPPRPGAPGAGRPERQAGALGAGCRGVQRGLRPERAHHRGRHLAAPAPHADAGVHTQAGGGLRRPAAAGLRRNAGQRAAGWCRRRRGRPGGAVVAAGDRRHPAPAVQPERCQRRQRGDAGHPRAQRDGDGRDVPAPHPARLAAAAGQGGQAPGAAQLARPDRRADRRPPRSGHRHPRRPAGAPAGPARRDHRRGPECGRGVRPVPGQLPGRP